MSTAPTTTATTAPSGESGAIPTKAQRSRSYRGIQVLRAVAALAVVYYHTADVEAAGPIPLPGTGSWGVDVFFVISGFVIGLVAFKGTRHFLRRRVIRVVPLYWVATLAWAAGAVVLRSGDGSTQLTPVTLLKSFFFIPFEMDGRPGPILRLGWTLNYEMFFYVVVGAALLVWGRSRPALVTAALLLSALGIAGLLVDPGSTVLETYVSPLLLEFLGGVLLAWLCVWGPVAARLEDVLARRPGLSVSVLVVTGTAGFVALVGQDVGWFGRIADERALAYGIPAFLVVLSAVCVEQFLRDSRLLRVLCEVGDGSYAIYLFHVFVVVAVGDVVLGRLVEGSSTPVRVLMVVVVAALTVAVGVAVNRWFDAPVQAWLRARFSPVPVLRGAATDAGGADADRTAPGQDDLHDAESRTTVQAR